MADLLPELVLDELGVGGNLPDLDEPLEVVDAVDRDLLP